MVPGTLSLSLNARLRATHLLCSYDQVLKYEALPRRPCGSPHANAWATGAAGPLGNG